MAEDEIQAILDFLWAKSSPRKELFCHSAEAAVAAGVLLTESIFAPLLEELSRWLGLAAEETVRLMRYLAANHDLGKAYPYFQWNHRVAFSEKFFQEHPEFQGNSDDVKDYRHEIGSKYAARRIWERDGVFSEDTGRAFEDVLALHHQGKSGNGAKVSEGDIWGQVQDRFEKKLRDWLRPPQVSLSGITHLDAACTVMTAVLILADWIVSSDSFADTEKFISEEKTADRVRSFLKTAGLDHSPVLSADRITDLWAWMNPETLRPLQKDLDNYLADRDEMPLAMILEAPMGEGKTEVGLYAAVRAARYWNKVGMYIGLPTAATANQMLTRVNAMLEEHGIGSARLMHSMAWLNEEQDKLWLQEQRGEGSADGIADWLKPTKRAMLSPWAVGTVDQALMAALHIRYGVLRLLGLTGKVLVLDEIHAYDAYMSSIIGRLLEWCRALRIPVIMLSATLPAEKKRDLLSAYTDSVPQAKGYPLITAVYENERLEEIPVSGSYQHSIVKIEKQSYRHSEWERTVDLALEKVRNGGCLCLLVNTVKSAQELYRALQNRSFDGKLMLFHSRFTAARRKEIEDECIRLFGPDHSSRPEQAVLVATQVVEQSLDLDFDAMITELAPIDLILQRIGRLHRHRDTVRPEGLREPAVTVLIPEDGWGASEMIYYPLFLERTKNALEKYGMIRIPDDIPDLVNKVYSGMISDLEEAERFYTQQFSDDFKSGKAKQLELCPPQEDEFTLNENQSVFLADPEDETGSSWAAAKTRLGDDSVRIALLPPSLFDEVKTAVESGSWIPEKLARKVMLYHISVRRTTLSGSQDGMKSGQLDGTGKLTGIRMYRALEERKPEETVTVVGEGITLCADREIGFWIEKRRG